MKILIVTPIFPPEIGGPATYVKEFASRVKSMGHDVRVITLSDVRPDKIEGVKIIKVPRRGGLLRHARLFLTLLKNASWSDVIYAQNPAAVGLPSVIVGKLIQKPVVIKYVGDTAWEKAFRDGKTKKFLEDFLREPDANKRLIHIERIVFRHAKRIITPSRFLAHTLSKYHKVPENKITIIPNAVELGDFRPRGEKQNAIITVARLAPWKGVQELISIMPELHKRTGVELWVVGDGPCRAELEAFAAKTIPSKTKAGKQLDGITFFGSLPRKETLDRIASARVFVLNSLYEGMPHVLLEAMAVGTPIVATNICGNPELIEDGKNGLLVPPNDKEKLKKALLDLLCDKAKSDRFASRGKELAKDYNWDKLMERTIDVLSFNT